MPTSKFYKYRVIKKNRLHRVVIATFIALNSNGENKNDAVLHL